MGIMGSSIQDAVASFEGYLNINSDNAEDADRQASSGNFGVASASSGNFGPESVQRNQQYRQTANHGSRNHPMPPRRSTHPSTSHGSLWPVPSAPSWELNEAMTMHQSSHRGLSVRRIPSYDDYADIRGRCQQAEMVRRAMEQQILQREQEIVQLRSHLGQEKHRRQEMEQKYNDLHLKIEKLEALHAEQALPDSGSYHDSAATPPLLQNAADGVKEAIVVCAHEFFSEFRRSPSINIHAVRVDIPMQHGSSEVTKAGLQGVLCRVLFQGFEDPYFMLTENHISPFQTPSERKIALFQAFRVCRDYSDASQLLIDDKDFRAFFHAKVALMNEEVNTWLLPNADGQFSVEPFLNGGVLDPSNENSIYNRKFLRAVKTVWVLHKLAMAFEPRAEIFRVARGSFFFETYMEDVATHDEDAEGNENRLPQRRVLFMCVPGFIVRQTVVKSRVFCLLSMNSESRDTTKDSQIEAGNGITVITDLLDHMDVELLTRFEKP